MAIPMTLNPIGRFGGEPYFSLIIKPGILGGMEYGFTPYWNEGGYCRVLDWGDGVAENAVTSGTVIKHTYTTAGTYRIKIIGDCWRVVFGQNPVYAELVYDSNGQWKFLGTLTSGEFMFWQCRNAIYTFQHFPDYITNIAYMFANNNNAYLQFKEFADTIINCTAAFNVCQKSRLQFKNIPALKELVQLFYDNHNSGINITEIPEEVRIMTSTFSRCYGPDCRISPHKIPDKIEKLNETFSFSESVYIDISELAANAPPEGWTNLTTISGLFYGSPNVVGSRSAFLAKCPPGIPDTNAFTGTNTTE